MKYVPASLIFLLCTHPFQDVYAQQTVIVPINQAIARAQLYVDLSSSITEDKSTIIDKIRKIKNVKLYLDDLAPYINEFSEEGASGPASIDISQAYPVLGLFRRLYPASLAPALNTLTEEDVTLDQKIGVFTLINYEQVKFNQSDLAQFLNKQAREYDFKAQRSNLLIQDLQLQETVPDQQDVNFNSLSRFEEIKGWPEPQNLKVSHAQIIFKSESNVYDSATKKDVVALTSSLKELKDNHFQRSSSVVMDSILTLPSETILSPSAQSKALRETIGATFKAIGPSASRTIIEVVTNNGQDANYRAFLGECLVQTAGSSSKAHQALQVAAKDYERRAQILRDYVAKISLK